MFLNKFELQEYYRNELDKLGYKNVHIWNILIDIKNKSLPLNIQEEIKFLENKIDEYKSKHNCKGMYTREYAKLQDMKFKLDRLKDNSYDTISLKKIDEALNELYYSKTVATQNRACKVALEYLLDK